MGCCPMSAQRALTVDGLFRLRGYSRVRTSGFRGRLLLLGAEPCTSRFDRENFSYVKSLCTRTTAVHHAVHHVYSWYLALVLRHCAKSNIPGIARGVLVPSCVFTAVLPSVPSGRYISCVRKAAVVEVSHTDIVVETSVLVRGMDERRPSACTHQVNLNKQRVAPRIGDKDGRQIQPHACCCTYGLTSYRIQLRRVMRLALYTWYSSSRMYELHGIIL